MMLDDKQKEVLEYLRKATKSKHMASTVLYPFFEAIFYRPGLGNQKNRPFTSKEFGKHYSKRHDDVRRLYDFVSHGSIEHHGELHPKYGYKYVLKDDIFQNLKKLFAGGIKAEKIYADFFSLLEHTSVVWPILKYLSAEAGPNHKLLFIKKRLELFKKEKENLWADLESETGLDLENFIKKLYSSELIKYETKGIVLLNYRKFQIMQKKFQAIHRKEPKSRSFLIESHLPKEKTFSKSRTPSVKIKTEKLKDTVDYFELLKENALVSWPWLKKAFARSPASHKFFKTADSEVFSMRIEKLKADVTHPFMEKTKIRRKDFQKVLFRSDIVQPGPKLTIDTGKLNKIKRLFEKQEKLKLEKIAKEEKETKDKAPKFIHCAEISDKFIGERGLMSKMIPSFGPGLRRSAVQTAINSFAKKSGSPLVDLYEDTFKIGLETFLKKLEKEDLLIKLDGSNNPIIKINSKEYKDKKEYRE